MGDGSQVRNCTLWDVSDAGVRIAVDGPSDVPEEFSLILSLDGDLRRRCRVIWRTEQELGACYVAAQDWKWTA
jgi:PilZ domain